MPSDALADDNNARSSTMSNGILFDCDMAARDYHGMILELREQYYRCRRKCWCYTLLE